MKKIAFWSYYENFAVNNNIFQNECNWYNKLFHKYNKLYSLATNNGYSIKPLSDCLINEIDIFLCYDIPNHGKKIHDVMNTKGIYKILVIEECFEIRPENWDKRFHENFDIIFTWSNDLISNNPEKYKKIYLTNMTLTKNLFNPNQRRLNKLVMINSNKINKSINELYSLRKKIIKNLENNDKFCLYGNDWNRYVFNMNSILSIFNSQKFSFIFRLFHKNYKCWKGIVKNKDFTLANFDFSFTIENTSNLNDYITEKITDSMIVGTIPVYLGASNIQDYFPKNTFIDIRDFKSIKDLNDFIFSMKEDDIVKYRKAIKDFLLSKDAYKFTTDAFAETLVSSFNAAKKFL